VTPFPRSLKYGRERGPKIATETVVEVEEKEVFDCEQINKQEIQKQEWCKGRRKSDQKKWRWQWQQVSVSSKWVATLMTVASHRHP